MAWQDKTLEAKYTAPSGKVISFLWEKTSRETALKTGVFTFPDRDGAHVQHQGAGAKSFPLTCIFSGDDCMERADEFEAALFERDVAELQHPVYGIIKVIPTGNIKREDDFISALNESHVTVTFTETITEGATPMDMVTAAEIDETYERFSESAAADFAGGISTDTVEEELRLQSTLNTLVRILDGSLIPLAAGNSTALAEMKTIFGELRESITALKKTDPAEGYYVKAINTAGLILNLMKPPSRSAANIMEKLESYSAITINLINQFRYDIYGVKNVANTYKSTNLVLSGCVAVLASGAAVSMAQAMANVSASHVERTPVVSGGISKSFSDGGSGASPAVRMIAREETARIVNGILTLFEKTKTFQDSKIEKNVMVDSDSNTHFLLNKLVYSSARLIMDISLSLPMRRTVTLDQDRQLVELVCELYGAESFIDRFIADNDLSIDELEVIPMGREVSYVRVA